jgi:hypothetical protein
MLVFSSKSKFLAIFLKFITAGANNLVSFLLPGALTKGAIMLQFLSQKGTTLSPLKCLWPLYPKLSPLF